MLASGISAALRFFAFPLLASLMTPEEFGRATLFLATLPFLALATSWNLAVPWVVDYHGETEDVNRRRMGGAIAVAAGSGLVLGAIAWNLQPWIEARLDFGASRAGYLQMIACSAFSTISLLYLELDKIRQETSRYLLESLLQTVLQLGAGVAGVFVAGPTFPSFLAGHTAGCAAVLLVQVVARPRNTTPLRPPWRETLGLWGRALPITLSSALAVIASLGDRQFVRAAAGYADVALYTMGAKIGEISQQILQLPLLAAMAPALLAVFHKDPEAFPRRFGDEMRRFLGLSLLASTSLGASLDILYAYLLPASYAPGIPVSIFFLWSFAIGGIGQVWATGVLAQGRLYAMMRFTATAAVSSLVFNSLLTPRYHAFGAAMAAVIVQSITCLQSWSAAGNLRKAIPGGTRFLLWSALVLPGLQLASALFIPAPWWNQGLRIALWGMALLVLLQQNILQEAWSRLRQALPHSPS